MVWSSGWDAIRTARHESLNGLGVLQRNWDISRRDADVPPWQQIGEQDWQASKMATYAAMVDRVDQSLGRLIATLKSTDQFDNTVILFMSDNGGSAEFMAEDGWAKDFPDTTHDGQRIRMGNIPGLRPGDALTYQSYDKPWANVSNAPFRQFKHHVHEGGIATPLIAHWPQQIAAGSVSHEPVHVIDVLPTLLDLSGCAALSEVNDLPTRTLDGESFAPVLTGNPWQREQPLFFEHEGNCAVRSTDFKVVKLHGQPWELYDMNVDRTELNNLAGTHQPHERAMTAAYERWADQHRVMDWDLALPRLLAAWGVATVDG